MTLKDILLQHKNAPMDQSLGPVADALKVAPVLIAVRADTPDDLQFQVAADKQGLLWVYAFSDEEEFGKVFPQGGAFAEMTFADVLDTIGPDERFGGVFINSQSEAMYPVPRQVFGFIYQRIAG